jgi:hypothetical protein
MFAKRLNFIMLMQKHRPGSYPKFPLDMKKKSSQYACRDLALRGVEEMFEALAHLKNWKPHRMTEIDEEIDREAFLEEIVDALNYFFSVLVITGFDEDDLHDAYVKKDKIITDRVLNGY